jgi:glycosyltransferase involved in cell wall biosynthesis
MKKIALLHYAYPPNIGGVEILMREQAHILANLGYDITVLTGSGREENPKIKLIEVKELQSILRFNPQLYKRTVREGVVDDEFFSLSSTIKEKLDLLLKDSEVIIVHNMLTLIHNLAFDYAFKKFCLENPQKKILIWVHDQTYIDREKVLKKKEGVNLGTESKKILLEPVANAVYIVISETFKKLLLEIMSLDRNFVTVIPNGINIKKFLEIDNSIWQFLSKTELLKSFPIILSPVNVLPRKNLDYRLKIISTLKKTYPQIKYIITGKPSIHRETIDYFNLLKKIIVSLNLTNQTVFLADHFSGSLNDSEIHDFYQLSDCVFYFSATENFGLPILEASLTKTPIFVSDLNVFHEVGGEFINYIDYKTIEPQQAADIVKEFIEKNSLIKVNFQSRTKYNLETIIKEKLIPLL